MKILLLGCGRMGGALLKGWIASGISPASVTVVEPNIAERLQGCVYINDYSQLTENYIPDAVVVAVKPQVFDGALKGYAAKVWKNSVFISIAAGITIAAMQHILGGGQPVVRAMPNLPAVVGKGATVAVAGSSVTQTQKTLAERLLGAVGILKWADDESIMDAVTAVSGSGPAYFYLLVEKLQQAGIKAGLPEEMAAVLAYQTFIGAAELLSVEGKTATELRQSVTSPGGTTEAAIKEFEKDERMSVLVKEAVDAAVSRGKALGASPNP